MSTSRTWLTALNATLCAMAAVTVAAGSASAAPSVKCHGHVATIVGTNTPDALTGTAGRDVIAGQGGRDMINGRGGKDLICGGQGRDSIAGGPGADVGYGDGGRDVLSEHGNHNVIVGGSGFDLATPYGAADRISAEAVDFSFQTAAVTANLATGQASGRSIGKDTLDGVINLTGTSHSDHLDGDGNANALNGGDGDDYINGHGDNDLLDGRAGAADVRSARSDEDTLIGGAGNDGLTDDSEADLPYSSDTMRGGRGDDAFTVGGGSNVIGGGPGNDRFAPEVNLAGYSLTIDLAAGSADSEVSTNTLSGVENADGSANDDVIHGDGGANYLIGMAGDDTITGEGGNDLIDAGHNFVDISPGDSADGGDGTDTCYATTTTNCETTS